MSHYHHHHHHHHNQQRQHGHLPLPIEQQQQPALNLAPNHRGGIAGGYRYASAVSSSSILPNGGSLRYPGDLHQGGGGGGDPFQNLTGQPVGYPLPWTFHPQYGDPHQQQPQQHHPMPVHGLPPPPHSVPSPANNHIRPQNYNRPAVPANKQFYPMPSPATALPTRNLEGVGDGRTGSSQAAALSSVSPDPDQMKDHCDSIIQHPLFPLLRLLLEKLEEATVTAVTPAPEEINGEVENLVRLIQQSSSSVSTGRPEIDDLMLQAVTVLRLHLFELEKVNELCRDFCDRYTACLRKNLHTDQILRADSFDLEESPPPNGHPRQPTATAPAARSNSTSSAAYGSPVNITAASGASYDTMGGNTHGLVAQQNQMSMMSGSNGSIHREERLSMTRDVLSPASGGGSMYDDVEKCDHDPEDSSSPAGGGGKMSRRGILPKDAINVMKTWLFQHIMHPYPTEDEKRILSGQTHLSLLQVNNWFINARRRILQPMLDASNPGGHRPKKGMQSRPVDPFWTGSAAASVSPAGGPTQRTDTQENHPGQRGTHRDSGNDEDRGGDMSDFESVSSPGDTALHD